MNTRRPLQVRIVSVTRGNETAVGVRRLDNDLAIKACLGIGHEGAAHALLAMVKWCNGRGHVIVNQPLDVAASRAA